MITVNALFLNVLLRVLNIQSRRQVVMASGWLETSNNARGHLSKDLGFVEFTAYKDLLFLALNCNSLILHNFLQLESRLHIFSFKATCDRNFSIF